MQSIFQQTNAGTRNFHTKSHGRLFILELMPRTLADKRCCQGQVGTLRRLKSPAKVTGRSVAEVGGATAGDGPRCLDEALTHGHVHTLPERTVYRGETVTGYKE